MQTNSFKLLSNNIKKIKNLKNKETTKAKIMKAKERIIKEKIMKEKTKIIKEKIIKEKVIKEKAIMVKRNGIQTLIGKLGLIHAQNKVINNAGKTGSELN